jgi:hypothetical protein
MQIQIALPDDVAHSLEAKWGSLERKLLEMKRDRRLSRRHYRYW